MLAAIFGVERFQTYVYARSFTIESDHKLLESVSQKNLADMPACLQCMLLCLKGYDYTICYHPGKEMALPNTLSVQSMSWTWHPTGHCHPPCLPVPREEGSIPTSFCEQPEMCTLTDMIITGWPDDIKVVPHPLCPYWQHCETLTIEDCLVLHGEALIIPPSERERMLQELHQFHQGTTKAQLFMHGCVFWLGINKAIEEAVWQCKTCTQFQAQNAAAPLTPTSTPSHPWQMCVMDIFTLEGINYLICSNFYSKMILIWPLPSGQSNTVKVISWLKEMFLEHGIPKVLHSDNSPQYASAQFTEFCISWGITHETSSPHHPQSNAFVRHV